MRKRNLGEKIQLKKRKEGRIKTQHIVNCKKNILSSFSQCIKKVKNKIVTYVVKSEVLSEPHGPQGGTNLQFTSPQPAYTARPRIWG